MAELAKGVTVDHYGGLNEYAHEVFNKYLMECGCEDSFKKVTSEVTFLGRPFQTDSGRLN